ncbi:MAG: 30S ribosomal protein S16 [Candidatus Magasanikbacteria bacterium]|nr:30S ribosomal protein S16 [Candidatus Magasanikbacteria bacterium]
MLTIRLQRIGRTNHPTYRLIISEKARDTKDKYLELLGSYDPYRKEDKYSLKIERIQYWLSKGAQTSATVHNLLLSAGVTTGAKRKAVYLSIKRRAKLAEKKKSASTAAPAPAATPESAPSPAAAEETAPAPSPASA